MLCSVCIDGWVRDANSRCINCHGNKAGIGPTIALAAGFFIFIFLGSSILMIRSRKSDESYDKELARLRKVNKIINQLKILIGFLQISTNMGPTFGMRFPKNFEDFMNSLNVVNLDFTTLLGAVDACAFSVEPLHSFVFQITLVPTFTITVYLAYFFRARTMQCVSFLSGTRCAKKLCKCQPKIKATVLIRKAESGLAAAQKKQATAANVYENLKSKLQKKLEMAKDNAKKCEDRAAKASTERLEAIQKLQAAQANNTGDADSNAGANLESLRKAHEEATASDRAEAKRMSEEISKSQRALIDAEAGQQETEEKLEAAVLEAEQVLEDLEFMQEQLKEETQAARDRLIYWINAFLFLAFPGITMKTFRVLDCTKILNEEYLSVDLSVQCWVGRHDQYRYLAIAMIYVYVMMVPLITFFFLHRYRHAMHDEEHPLNATTRRRFGGLFLQYEPQFWFWEVIEMLRKIFLTGGLLLVFKGQTSQLFVGQLICLAYLLLVVRTLPYQSDADDFLQTTVSSVILINLLIAMILKTDDSSPRQYDADSMGLMLIVLNSTVVLTVLVCILIILFPITCSRLQARMFKKCKPVNLKPRTNSSAITKVKPVESKDNSSSANVETSDSGSNITAPVVSKNEGTRLKNKSKNKSTREHKRMSPAQRRAEARRRARQQKNGNVPRRRSSAGGGTNRSRRQSPAGKGARSPRSPRPPRSSQSPRSSRSPGHAGNSQRRSSSANSRQRSARRSAPP